jgi:Sec20
MDGKGTAAVTDARQITASLRRVHTTMSSSVMNADEAVSVLLQDGAILEDTLQDHKYGLKGSLQTTKHRLSRIKSAETREAYMIFLSLSFFTSVVMYIIAKRTRLLTIAWLALHGAIRGKNAITSMTSKVGKVELNASSDISMKNLNESLMINLSQENLPLISNAKVLNIPESMNTEHIEDSIDLSTALNTVIDDVPINGMMELLVEDVKVDTEISTAIISESGEHDVSTPALATVLNEAAATISDATVDEQPSSSSSSISIDVDGSGENVESTDIFQTHSISVENLDLHSEVQDKSQEGYLNGEISVEDIKAEDLQLSTATVLESALESESESDLEVGLRDGSVPPLTTELSEISGTGSDMIVEESSSSSSTLVSIDVDGSGESVVNTGIIQTHSVSVENLDLHSEVQDQAQSDEFSQSEEGHVVGEHTQNEQYQQIKEENNSLGDRHVDEVDSTEQIRYVGPVRSYMRDETIDPYDHRDDDDNNENDVKEENGDGGVDSVDRGAVNANEVHSDDKEQPIIRDDNSKQEEDHIDIKLNGENNFRDEL